jgi:hypothetical protein
MAEENNPELQTLSLWNEGFSLVYNLFYISAIFFFFKEFWPNLP